MLESADPSTTPLVVMKGIVKSFPGVRALDHVDFSLRAGEVHMLLGERGRQEHLDQGAERRLHPRRG